MPKGSTFGHILAYSEDNFLVKKGHVLLKEDVVYMVLLLQEVRFLLQQETEDWIAGKKIVYVYIEQLW